MSIYYYYILYTLFIYYIENIINYYNNTHLKSNYILE